MVTRLKKEVNENTYLATFSNVFSCHERFCLKKKLKKKGKLNSTLV